MNTPLFTALILAAQSPQFYHDALQQARNPFEPLTEIRVQQDVQEQEEAQITEPVAEPINPDMILKLDRLKAILKTKRNHSVLYLGDEIARVTDSFYGMQVVEITLDRIILQNDFHMVQKYIGKPIEIKPRSSDLQDELPFYGENQE